MIYVKLHKQCPASHTLKMKDNIMQYSSGKNLSNYISRYITEIELRPQAMK